MLQTYLPEDIAERATGRVKIGMTNFNRFESFPFSGVLVDEFLSKDDLVDAVCASCHIPGYLGPSIGSPFRGQVSRPASTLLFLDQNLTITMRCDESLLRWPSWL